MCYKQLFNRRFGYALNKKHTLQEIAEISNVPLLDLEWEYFSKNKDYLEMKIYNKTFVMDKVYFLALIYKH